MAADCTHCLQGIACSFTTDHPPKHRGLSHRGARPKASAYTVGVQLLLEKQAIHVLVCEAHPILYSNCSILDLRDLNVLLKQLQFYMIHISDESNVQVGELWMWTDAHLLSLRAAYLLGRCNQIADELSCSKPLHTDWQIYKEVFRLIWNISSREKVDLFVSAQQ